MVRFTCYFTWSHLPLVKLITNRWAWALVPTKLVEPGNALAWGGGIHGNPASSPRQAPSHWTIQWNTYRPNTYLAHTKREGGMGKPKHKLARKQQAIPTTLCKELQASNCVYKSWGAPARGIGPPLLWLEKQLTSIALRLTLPKLRLATLTFCPKECKTTQHGQSLHLLLFLVPNCKLEGKPCF